MDKVRYMVLILAAGWIELEVQGQWSLPGEGTLENSHRTCGTTVGYMDHLMFKALINDELILVTTRQRPSFSFLMWDIQFF